MRRIDKVMGNSSNASMIIAHDRAGAHETALALEKKISEAKKRANPFISSVRWLDQFFPQDQQEKLVIVKRAAQAFFA